jgi:hypothetical protein
MLPGAVVDAPLAVHSEREELAYWRVPVESHGQHVGFVDVDPECKVLRYGTYPSVAAMPGTHRAITQMTPEEISHQIRTDLGEAMSVAGDPGLVAVGGSTRIMWSVPVIDGESRDQVALVTPGFAWLQESKSALVDDVTKTDELVRTAQPPRQTELDIADLTEKLGHKVNAKEPRKRPFSRSDSDEHLLFRSLTTFNGVVVRITRPEMPPLMLPKDSPYDGQFHRAGEQLPLYASTRLATAWARLVRSNLSGLATGSLEERVSELRVASARVLDLRGPALEFLGFDRGVLYSTGRYGATHKLASLAREAGAEGLLVPSRWSDEGVDVVVFANALDRVTVLNTQVRGLTLADATEDEWVREFLESDGEAVREFVSALENGKFERWVSELNSPPEVTAGLRALAERVAP